MKSPKKIILDENLTCISLGGNEGNVLNFIKQAIQRLIISGFKLVAYSSAYKTSPVDCVPQTQDFYNAVILGRWTKSPQDLLNQCQKIEKDLGRNGEEKGRKMSRPIDLDIIFIGTKQIVDDDKLVIPHPRATSRLFVLIPLAEIMPYLKFPGTDKTVEALLDALIMRYPEESQKILRNKIPLLLELE